MRLNVGYFFEASARKPRAPVKNDEKGIAGAAPERRIYRSVNRP